MAAPHSNEVKAAAVAAVLAGESVSSVAKQFGVSRAAIVEWRDKTGITGEVTPVAQQKKHDLGMQVYGLLEDSIAHLRFQLRVTADEEWIKRQTANDLAIYHGVIADKTVRLLAAFRPPDDDSRGEIEV